MKISENTLTLEQLEHKVTDSYIFKYGERAIPPDGDKIPLRVNIVFEDGILTKLQFLDTDEPIDVKNLLTEKVLIMDAVATKIKTLEASFN